MELNILRLHRPLVHIRIQAHLPGHVVRVVEGLSVCVVVDSERNVKSYSSEVNDVILVVVSFVDGSTDTWVLAVD